VAAAHPNNGMSGTSADLRRDPSPAACPGCHEHATRAAIGDAGPRLQSDADRRRGNPTSPARSRPTSEDATARSHRLDRFDQRHSPADPFHVAIARSRGLAGSVPQSLRQGSSPSDDPFHADRRRLSGTPPILRTRVPPVAPSSVNASPSAGALPESRCATHATGGLFTQASPRRTRRARSPSRRVPVDTARLSVRLERRHHRPVPTPSSWARPLRVLRALLALRALRGEIPDRPCDCLGPRMNRIYRIGVGALGRQRGTRLAIHVAAPPPAMLGARPRWAPDGTRDRSKIRITTSPRRRPGSRCRRSPPVGSPRAPRRVASVRLGTRSVPDRAA
jgi:hypothetical protein